MSPNPQVVLNCSNEHVAFVVCHVTFRWIRSVYEFGGKDNYVAKQIGFVIAQCCWPSSSIYEYVSKWVVSCLCLSVCRSIFLHVPQLHHPAIISRSLLCVPKLIFVLRMESLFICILWSERFTWEWKFRVQERVADSSVNALFLHIVAITELCYSNNPLREKSNRAIHRQLPTHPRRIFSLYFWDV
jgi:hypothetical protein